MSEPGVHGILATILDTPEFGKLRVRPDSLVVADGDGQITLVLQPGDESYEQTRHRLERQERLAVIAGYVLPGLVDLHAHAPQWPQLGKALDVPLEVWLNKYTFPLEARYDDLEFASSVYRSLVSSLLRIGTTTAVYFGTVHRAATQLLVDECVVQGQRAVIGKVAMDNPAECPDYYRDASAAEALDETTAFIEYVRSHDGNQGSLVRPAITPRFLPSCTDELLAGLGELAAATSALVQTHCSESDWAHQYGLERFGRTDTASYFEFGLLRRGTVLAHSNFITEADMDLIARAGAAVAHCPRSNVFFANAVFPVRRALGAGVRVGLGTDIAGGPSASLFDAAVDAVAVSRLLEDGVDAKLAAGQRGIAGSRISFVETFWMATAGGGQALGLPIGLIEPGYQLDAVAVSGDAPGSSLDVWPNLDSPADVLQKILHHVGRVDIAGVWVGGRRVIG